MAYTKVPIVSIEVPSIATSEAGAKAFLERLVMHSVFDILESQDSNALLSDIAILTILSQHSVWTSYKPVDCKIVVSPTDMPAKTIETYCIIVGNTVTGICTTVTEICTTKFAAKCNDSDPAIVTVTPVAADYTSIPETLSVCIAFSIWTRCVEKLCGPQTSSWRTGRKQCGKM
ncbi:hypothetical protein KIN20_028466 [Parelaphostrongylus tenuis]|uniref:Uncharacterized protein n=1 Tax=Parelaphostrongylus tenuis TaxID=148309 RepID=A0AAD5R1A8_PARTN|nr:hypothetical protein KIN20_028466 [Parelaphostrongylus tenuis]